MTPQTFLTCFQKALCAVKLLDCCYEKELDDIKAKILFSYLLPKDYINNYLYHGNHYFDSETLDDLKNFSRVVVMQTSPRKITIVMKKANPLVATTAPSLLMIMTTPCPYPQSDIFTTNLAIDLATR